MASTKGRNDEGKVANESNGVHPATLPTPALENVSVRMSYRIARGEQGVLSFEPYKSLLLPFWRFRTKPVAEHSSQQLEAAFLSYVERNDFVGADMARKFIQMGMTRAKRYANHKGGRKYNCSARTAQRDGTERTELPRSTGHADMEEKLQASELFRAALTRARADIRYHELKAEFLKEQKAWDREHGRVCLDKHTGQKRKASGDTGSLVKAEGAGD